MRKNVWALALSSFIFLWAVPAPAQQAAPLEQQIQAAASKGQHPAMVELTGHLLAQNPQQAKAHYLYGYALYQATRFEEAREHLEKASQLGMRDGDRYLIGIELRDLRHMARLAIKNLPPIRARYPDSGDYQIIVRYFAESNWSRHIEAMLPELAEQAEGFFGVAPEHVSFYVFPDPATAEKIADATDLEFNSTSRGAMGGMIGAYMFDQVGNPPTPVANSEQRYREVIAHEFAHAVSFRMKGTDLTKVLADWFEEGLAMYFADKVTGGDRPALLQQWKTSLGQTNRLSKMYVLGDFRESEFEGLNYLTSALMVYKLISQQGEGVVRQINQALTVNPDAGFGAAFYKVTANSPQKLYDQTVAEATQEAGIEKPPEVMEFKSPEDIGVLGRLGGDRVHVNALRIASLDNLYQDFLFAVAGPPGLIPAARPTADDEDDFGNIIYQLGYFDPKQQDAHSQYPAGYWVYFKDRWIVWGKQDPRGGYNYDPAGDGY